jgi:hypothetical protein
MEIVLESELEKELFKAVSGGQNILIHGSGGTGNFTQMILKNENFLNKPIK